jgi:hypothetical protein
MRTRIRSSRAALLAGILAAAGNVIFALRTEAAPAAPLDEAQLAHRDVASFPQAKQDYFHDMDNGVPMSDEEVRGRNMWLLWTAATTGSGTRFRKAALRHSIC